MSTLAAEHRKRVNARNASLRRATLCTWCRRPSAEGRTFCAEHLAATTGKQRANRQLKRRRDLARLSRLGGRS